MFNRWFLERRRDFPWRRNPSPYHIWVSEVMLQQTQASRVIAYFERWMERFPTIESLAKAPLHEVLKLWEGLGYYSRARALHKGAELIQEKYKGVLPSKRAELEEIPGLGPYTVSAILALGFHERGAAIDGNVLRLIARLFDRDDDIAKPKTRLLFQPLADSLLDEKEPWITGEALIELGATICIPKNPRCEACPLQKECKALQTGRERLLPYNSKKIQYEALFREVAVIKAEGHLLLRCGEAGKIMAGLYEFPYLDCIEGGYKVKEAEEKFKKVLCQEIQFREKLASTKQSFTKYRVQLFPKVYEARERVEVEGYEWKRLEEVEGLAFSSGHKRVLEMLK